MLLLDPHADESLKKPGLSCVSHLGIMSQRVPSPERLPSILVKPTLPLSDRLLRLDISLTHYSVRGSHQLSDILEEEGCGLFTVKLPLQNSSYTAGFLLSRDVMSLYCHCPCAMV